MDIYVCVYPHNYFCLKKIRKNFGGIKKKPYLCNCYPENNLFTLEN